MSTGEERTAAASVDVRRFALELGEAVNQERRRRHMGIRALASKARVATGTVHNVETGAPASLDTYARLAKALGRELRVHLSIPGRQSALRVDADLVHAAMGERQAAMLQSHAFLVSVDEPWQHFHFAGRADILAWDLARSAILHIENRTRFPDVQDAVGRFRGKRRYLTTALARSLGFEQLPRTETHVMVALWSNEVQRVLRRDPATFRATCPDPPDDFFAWWKGEPPKASRTTSFVLFDPFATGRQRRFLSLGEAIDGTRARVHDYAEAAERLRASRRE